MIAPRHDHDDCGFTLIELLLVIMIMGIVAAVVSQALILGMKLGPQTKDRTGVAANQSLLTNALSDDVANATIALPGPASQACTIPVLPATALPLATITVPGPTTILYTATVAPSGVAGINIAKVLRKVGTDPDQVMLTGYCTNAAANTFRVAYADPTFTAELTLRAGLRDPTQTIRFGGARRRV